MCILPSIDFALCGLAEYIVDVGVTISSILWILVNHKTLEGLLLSLLCVVIDFNIDISFSIHKVHTS